MKRFNNFTLEVCLVDIDWDKDASSWIEILSINSWSLFYLERQPDRGITWIEVLGIKIKRK